MEKSKRSEYPVSNGLNNFFFVFLVILSISLTHTCRSQWVRVGFDPGVVSLSASSSYLYAGAVTSVLRSSNNGQSWSTVFSDSGVIQNFVFANGNYVYVGTSKPYFPLGMFRSTNYGFTWTHPITNHNVNAVAFNGNYILAGLDSFGVFKSTDNGLSWNQTALNNQSIISLAINGNYIYAGTWDAGLYRSSDNGITWPLISFLNQIVWSIAYNVNNVYAGTTNSLYVSANNGSSWSQTSLNNNTIYSLALGGNYIFAGTPSKGVFVSSNFGINWITRNEGLDTADGIPSLCIYNNYIFAASFVDGVYRRPLSELIGIQKKSFEVPTHFVLFQNYPNPFNPVTVIKYALPKASQVKLVVYDITGREVMTLVNTMKQAGNYETKFDGTNISSGVYFYKIEAGDFTDVKKMVLIK